MPVRKAEVQIHCALTGRPIQEAVIYQRRICDKAALLERGIRVSELVYDQLTNGLFTMAQIDGRILVTDEWVYRNGLTRCSLSDHFPCRGAVFSTIDGRLYDRAAFIREYKNKPRPKSKFKNQVFQNDNLFVHPVYTHVMWAIHRARAQKNEFLLLSEAFHDFENPGEMTLAPPIFDEELPVSERRYDFRSIKWIKEKLLSQWRFMFPVVISFLWLSGLFLVASVKQLSFAYGLGVAAPFVVLLFFVVTTWWINIRSQLFEWRIRFRNFKWNTFFNEVVSEKEEIYYLSFRARCLLGFSLIAPSILFSSLGAVILLWSSLLMISKILALTGITLKIVSGFTILSTLTMGGAIGYQIFFSTFKRAFWIKNHILRWMRIKTAFSEEVEFVSHRRRSVTEADTSESVHRFAENAQSELNPDQQRIAADEAKQAATPVVPATPAAATAEVRQRTGRTPFRISRAQGQV